MNDQNKTTDSVQQTGLAGVAGSAFLLFAAHAPEIPKWFQRKEWDERVTVPAPDISPNHVRWGSKHHVEEPLAHLVRWRMAYAAAMVAALPNTKVTGDGAQPRRSV